MMNPPGLIRRVVFARPACLVGGHGFNVLGGSAVCYGFGGFLVVGMHLGNGP